MTPLKAIRMLVRAAFLLLPVVTPGSAAAQSGAAPESHKESRPALIPASIREEHEGLHRELSKALRTGGKTAAAAMTVDKLLTPHFEREEQFAMPPLGLFAPLAAGEKLPADPDDMIKLADRLKAEMPAMLREHREIMAALVALRTAAVSEHKRDAAQFADDLIAHARNEEQILYPSAILVGEYLKMKRQAGSR